jgi:hypothetical protein
MAMMSEDEIAYASDILVQINLAVGKTLQNIAKLESLALLRPRACVILPALTASHASS